jgi:hypothetical protein
MRGLDPRIHQFPKKFLAKKMDPRVKPAGDTAAAATLSLLRR